MQQYFNTTGPCNLEWHLMLAAMGRLRDVRRLLDRHQYFVLHAPRQAGRTNAMRALTRSLQAKGVAACGATPETARGRDDTDTAEPLWLDARSSTAQALAENWRAPETAYSEAVPHVALNAFLHRVVNGSGRVFREFASCHGATDHLVAYGPDRFAIALKRLRDLCSASDRRTRPWTPRDQHAKLSEIICRCQCANQLEGGR